MDERLNDLRQKGNSLGASKAYRLTKKPGQINPVASGRAVNQGFADLGSSGFKKDAPTSSKASGGKGKGREYRGPLSQKLYNVDFDDSSDDELSLTGRSSPIGGTPKIVHSVNTSAEGHQYHPMFLPKKPLPKFKKKNKPQSSSVAAENGTMPGPSVAKSNLKPVAQPRPRDSGDGKEKSTVATNSIAGGSKTKAKMPRPRPAYSRRDKSTGETDTPVDQAVGRKRTARNPQPHPLEDVMAKDLLDSSTTRIDATPKKRQNIPLPSPLSKPTPEGSPPLPSSPHSKNKTKREKQPFPMDSPIHDDSGLRAKKIAIGVDSDDAAEEGSDSDDILSMRSGDEVATRGGNRPFPMSTQVLESISKPLSNSSSGSSKRLSTEGNDEHGPSKRKREGDRLRDDFADMDLTLTEEIPDPSTLCPYCDEPFPSDPSPFLENMLNRVRCKSYRDPRPYNALGLKAPLAAFVSLCQRHRFEFHQLPKAKANGWPTRIDFSALPRRVEESRRVLEKVFVDKETSEFWREIGREIEKKGSRIVMSARGQFSSFEKSQPGYYGEQGAIIINQTLYNLFPPSTLNPDLIAPLTATEFIQRVLVPEAAVVLIRQDLRVDKSRAMEILRDSSQYGVAMFPDMDKDDVGEEMVRERARVRRQEIEQEEERERIQEQELLDETGSKQRRRGKGGNSGVKKAGRAKAETAGTDTATTVDTDSAAETDVSCKGRKGKGKKAIAASVHVGSSADESDAPRSKRRNVSRADERRNVGRSDVGGEVSMLDKKGKGKEREVQELEERSLCQKQKQMKTPMPRKRKQSVTILSSDEDETPKPSRANRKTGINMRVGKDTNPGPTRRTVLSASSHPLVMAKTRTSTRNEEAEWVFDMREQAPDSDLEICDGDDALSPPSHHRSAKRGMAHSNVRSRHKSYAWLLSD